MRVDVRLTDAMIEDELTRLEQRLQRRGMLASRAWMATPVEDVNVLSVHGMGRTSVYLKDAVRTRLVGFISFDVLPTRHHRTPFTIAVPHAKLLPEYRGLGLAKSVYEAELSKGRCLMSGARQSPGAAHLWRSLSRSFPLTHIWTDGRVLRPCTSEPTPRERERLEIRMLLHPPDVQVVEAVPPARRAAARRIEAAPAQTAR